MIKERKYTTKIKNSGALIPDTKTIFLDWDLKNSNKHNIERIHNENKLGKSSRLRIEEIITIFKQRYMFDDEVFYSIVEMVQGGLSSQSLDRILYYYATHSDRLLHDVVLEIIYPQYINGRAEIYTDEVCEKIYEWVNKGYAVGTWSHSTTTRVTRGILSTLRDYGILQGRAKKRISPTFLPTDAFSFISFYLINNGLTGKQVIDTYEWRLFLLDSFSVDRFFIEAQQEGYLNYQAAGDVIRIEYPCKELKEYAEYVIKKQN